MSGFALDAPVNKFTGKRLIPLYPQAARKISVNIGASQTLALGTVLGLVTSSANDVQTVTISGTPTGGTYTLNATVNGASATTAALAYNAAASAVQTALVALFGSGNVTVTGSAGGPYTVTFGGTFGYQPVPVMTLGTNSLTGGTSPTASIAHTTVGVTANTYVAYASGNSDGSQVARVLLEYDVATDAAGNVFFGKQAGSEWGQSYLSAPVFVNGDFNTADLVGLDSGAVTNLNARLLAGTVTSGVIHIP